jgi:cell wall-associated NlpC family hydrolase
MRVMLFGADKPAVHTDDFIDFAKSFLGTPYVWGSVNPKVGFDCSGFVNHVSKHFGFDVPRTSAQFVSLGEEIKQSEAQAGDIILFSGSKRSKKVNHMGIVVENPNGELQFIHASRGKKNVNLSGMTDYFQDRLVKIVRIFPLDSHQQIDVGDLQTFPAPELQLPIVD